MPKLPHKLNLILVSLLITAWTCSGCLIGEHIQREELIGTWFQRFDHGSFRKLTLREDSSFTYQWQGGLAFGTTDGTWKTRPRRVILTSEFQPPHPFHLLEQKKVPGDTLTVRIVDEDFVPIGFGVFTLFKGKEVVYRGQGNEDGIAILPIIDATNLRISAMGWVDFPLPDSAYNYFSFQISTWSAFYRFFEEEKWKYRKGKLYQPFYDRQWRYLKKWPYQRVKD